MRLVERHIVKDNRFEDICLKSGLLYNYVLYLVRQGIFNKEYLANTGNVVGSGGTLEVSSSGGRFDRIAFKNLAIYPRILSKDDCIKAYNYLQTLKAK